MNVYKFDIKKNIQDEVFKDSSSILILGEFETFHVGHNQLLKQAKEIQENELIGIFIIKREQENFQTIDLRLNNLAKIGFDFVIVAEFNFEFKSIEGDIFINYLLNNFNINSFVVGEDFRFGLERKFKANDIENISNKKTYIIENYKIDGIKISSSDIKQMHEFGEYNLIKNLVVNPLVFPIKIFDKKIIWRREILKPHFGNYYFKLLIDGYWYSGVINFSIANSIDFKLVNIEENKEIFDQESEIKILDIQRIITNQRFDNITDEDIKIAQDYFSI